MCATDRLHPGFRKAEVLHLALLNQLFHRSRNVFDRLTGNLLEQLDSSSGIPIVNPGPWDLTFGNGGNGGGTSDLYFTAGPAAEDHGLLGSIAPAPTPEPGALALLASGFLALFAYQRRRANSLA